MRLRPYLPTALGCAALAAVGATGYFTREHWLPYVFPVTESATAGGTAPEPEPAAGGNRVKLSPQAQKNLGLDVDNPTPQEYWRTLLIPGSVVDRPGESDRSVTAKVAGVVLEIRAKPGDTVEAGAPLFTLQLTSEFLQTAQADLAKAARESEFAIAKRDRTADLVKGGAGSASVLIEDENQVKRFAMQISTLRRQLIVFGLSADQMNRAERGDAITEIVVAAPGIAKQILTAKDPPGEALYEMQELGVTLGEQVAAGQKLATLANHRQLYVEGRAFKSEADALAAAAERRVPIRAEFSDEAPGTWKVQDPLLIRHLSNQVDPATRTFGFYLPLENQPRAYVQDGKARFVWRYHPGQRVRLRVPVERLDKPGVLPFVFPAGAVVREGAEAYVFVQTGDIFVRKPVHVLHEDRNEVVVANDGSVSEADFVCRNQAAAINRALKAAAGGDEPAGHEHSH